ncbi:serine/threonine-protein kinase [Tuwongella immobilis]|uniref:Protein kinase domain-containing protein n=1 Tax=Tuwongella immobilis TaxID=692036 RepID=A0A6C2YSX9_9BACT|nr:serine/threonine-protein kinase [Tuwongella immobilis]VIP04437.1 serine threonine protein kinase : Serine/threonine protein kinase OS=Gallionella capsiferriformans (strain ES-2) GN=Galf_1181 PE=4 SV=1: Pkinase [Tuwongella immobilis]VTS06236.1 serine threonine protein kinase : Serine/threonine protein kinase OS=Gallionella capsiferriformans (strain ES-2) GN=Galf_1181 PE=4 SV=1: Pkinase [Tuwongella immobilis]
MVTLGSKQMAEVETAITEKLGVAFPADQQPALEAFLRAWNSTNPPRIADYLPQPEHPSYLPTLLAFVSISSQFHHLYRIAFDLEKLICELPALQPYADRYRSLPANVDLARRLQLSPPLPEPPRQLGRYRVLETLGFGSVGQVVRAIDPDVPREVAIKMVHPSQTGVVGDLLREGQMSGKLNHPNIVPILEVLIHPGEVALVMPLIRGGTLADRIRTQGRMSWQWVQQFLAECGAALDYLHDQQIIHRDIKPGNILLQGETPRLSDFSHACPYLPNHPLPQGMTQGTPIYAAPEVLLRQSQTDASDRFSFGLVVLEALTGVRMERPDAWSGVRESELRAQMSSLLPCPPDWLQTAIIQLLHPDPNLRPSRIRNLLADLAPSPCIPSPPRTSRLMSRWIPIAGIAGVAALVCTVGPTLRARPDPRMASGISLARTSFHDQQSATTSVPATPNPPVSQDAHPSQPLTQEEVLARLDSAHREWATYLTQRPEKGLNRQAWMQETQATLEPIIAIHEQLSQYADQIPLWPTRLLGMQQHAAILRELERFQQAEQVLQELHRVGSNYLQMMPADPVAIRLLLSNNRLNLAHIYWKQQQYAKADEIFASVSEQLEELWLSTRDSNAEKLLCEVLTSQGDLYHREGRFDTARVHWGRALHQLQQRYATMPLDYLTRIRIVHVGFFLGESLLRNQECQRAMECYRFYLPILRELVQEFPDSAIRWHQLATTIERLVEHDQSFAMPTVSRCEALFAFDRAAALFQGTPAAPTPWRARVIQLSSRTRRARLLAQIHPDSESIESLNRCLVECENLVAEVDSVRETNRTDRELRMEAALAMIEVLQAAHRYSEMTILLDRMEQWSIDDPHLRKPLVAQLRRTLRQLSFPSADATILRCRRLCDELLQRLSSAS